MRRAKSSGFFGVVLVLAGVIFLLKNVGLVDISILQYFSVYWPAGLILAGIAIVYRRRDIGFAIIAVTFVVAIVYGAGQIEPFDWSFDFVNPGINCVEGSGNVTTDERALVEFTEIHASSGVNVFLGSGAEASARVEADDNIIYLVKTKADDGKLEIYMDSCVKNAKPVNVYVTFQDLDKISAISAAKIFVESDVSEDSVEIRASSAGDVTLGIDVNSVQLYASSAGKITVSGSADSVDARASSSGIVNAFELVSDDVEAVASSAGIVQVYAEDNIKAKASSAGKVQYKGSPVQVDETTSSGGIVGEIS